MNLREELQNRYLTLIDPSRSTASAQASADSRIVFFWQAVGLWSEHPVFGVGPGAFGTAMGHGTQAHSLYGQVLAELGTAGGIALLAIILGFCVNMRQAWRFRRARPELGGSFLYRTCLAAFVTIPLLLLLGLGGHNMFRYTWLWYGAFQVIALRLLQEHIAELPAGRITYEDPRESYSHHGQPAFSA
jgi:O-antigen ligase